MKPTGKFSSPITLPDRSQFNFYRKYPLPDRSQFTKDLSGKVIGDENLPVFAPNNGALSYFLNNGDFGQVNLGEDGYQPLMDLLPLARQGFAFEDTFTKLLYAHIYANDLLHDGKIYPSETMNIAFGGVIPSLYVKIQVGKYIDEKIIGYEDDILIVEQYSIPIYEKEHNRDLLNTYQAISKIKPKFDYNSFGASMIPSILTINIVEWEDGILSIFQPLGNDLFEDPQIIHQLFLERKIVSDALTRIKSNSRARIR